MEESLGLVHIYCGDGKGKTTAAMGLALRAIGSGKRVLVVQFLKDGSSGEIAALRQFPTVNFLVNDEVTGFTFNMSEGEKLSCKDCHNRQLQKAIELCDGGEVDLLVLDEAIGAINGGVLDEEIVLNFLQNRPQNVEIALTGRNPSEAFMEIADYISEIKKLKHPFDKGISARTGIEK